MPESRQRSVRRQLLVLLLTAVSVAWIIAATISFRDARHEVAEVLDAHLAQTAALISVQRDGDEREDEDEVDTEHAPVLHRYGRRVMLQVWRNGTTLGLHSQHAPDTPLSKVRDGFSDATIGGTRWRVFSTWDARSRVLVQVAEQTTSATSSRRPWRATSSCRSPSPCPCSASSSGWRSVARPSR
jgi:two-component system sensor histidine kinase QseC